MDAVFNENYPIKSEVIIDETFCVKYEGKKCGTLIVFSNNSFHLPYDENQLKLESAVLEEAFQCKDEDNLPKHVNNVAPLHKYICNACDHNTWCKPYLKSHMKIYRVEEHICKECEYKTVCECSLKAHFSDEYKYKECDYKTLNKCIPNLNAHLNIHTGVQFKCKECHLQTMWKHNLKMHMKTHTGEPATRTFRSTFKHLQKDLFNWFPGHMGKGLKQMQTKLKLTDCIIEVHDARIPFSGRNLDFKYKISGIKPHILVINKMDLINPVLIPKIKQKLSNECPYVIFTNCKDQKCKGVKSIFPLAQKLIANSDRYNRANEDDNCIMIIGIPNVGKSSLVNTLRNRFLKMGNAAPVGAKPGMTRSVMNKIKISENPLCYMLDTPGILTPSVTSVEAGLKLALCATIEDHLVGEEIIADYLLYWLNKNKMFQYVDVLKLEAPTDDILKVLTEISIRHNKFLKVRDCTNTYIIKPNVTESAHLMIQSFRNGSLGKLMLDSDIL
ncbi:hypothetical protein FQA39_LY07239 [Lamprigera yunnana]|nr:hypothetical protein FQA39_LY07239 [Lamprigera yunnana]